jgi:hypothetical protein
MENLETKKSTVAFEQIIGSFNNLNSRNEKAIETLEDQLSKIIGDEVPEKAVDQCRPEQNIPLTVVGELDRSLRALDRTNERLLALVRKMSLLV